MISFAHKMKAYELIVVLVLLGLTPDWYSRLLFSLGILIIV